MPTVVDLPLPGLPGPAGYAVRHLPVGDAGYSDIQGSVTVREDLLAPTGYLHAATVVALADTAAGYGCLASLPPGATGFTTIELKCNFLRTAAIGDELTVLATGVHRGRTTQVWDATVTAGRDPHTAKNIGLFRCTQLILGAQAPSPATSTH